MVPKEISAEDRLVLSKELFHRMTEGFVLQNQSGEIVYFNDAALAILGLTKEELLGVKSTDPMWRTIREDGSAFPGEDHPASVALRTKASVSEVRMGVQRKDGTLKWIAINASPTSDGVIVTFRDITSLKESESNFKRISERFEFVQSTLKFGVWDWDYVNNKLEWDDFQYKLFGIPKEKFTGAYEAFASTLQGEEGTRVSNELQAAFEKQTDFQSSFHSVNQTTGEPKIIGAAAKCFYNAEGKIQRLVGANWDITEQKLSEAKLIQASKMSSLGEMASGIAHEINNPLTIIQGLAFIVGKLSESEHPEKKQKIAELTTKIGTTVQRIAKIIQALRTFSRNDDADPEDKLSISAVIQETLELCQERMKSHNIELKVHAIPDVIILGHSASLSQCFLNLLNNAHDAILDSESPWIEIKAELKPDLISIRITDSGRGISQEVADRLFTPFFTTKAIGSGTGLGLSITKGIIEKHKGKISLDRSVANTCFVIEIPVFKEA